MPKTPFLFIANWKAQKPVNKAKTFIHEHRARISHLMQEVQAQMVICPSPEALALVHEMFRDYTDNVFLGSQSCAPALVGAFTGQVPILSLAELHCSYCIIGHSETREYGGETDTSIAFKAPLLLDQGIIPIICIGETQQEYDNNHTQERLEIQLNPLFESLAHKMGTCYIAYEPRWAIGSGKVPTAAYIQQMFEYIQHLVNRHLSHLNINLLYGGSVSEQSIEQLRLLKKNTHPALTGFLIGNASLDLADLTKIVRLWYV